MCIFLGDTLANKLTSSVDKDIEMQDGGAVLRHSTIHACIFILGFALDYIDGGGNFSTAWSLWLQEGAHSKRLDIFCAMDRVEH